MKCKKMANQEELQRHADRTKQRHLRISSGTEENEGEMRLTIHDKNGNVHASWIFTSPEDAMDFADMVNKAAIRYREELNERKIRRA